MSPTGGFSLNGNCELELTHPSENLQKLAFSNRASTDHVKSRGSPLTTASLNVFQRPLSAFSRHRSRELSDIREASGSSKDTAVRRKLSRMLDGTNERKVSKSASQHTSPDEAAAADVELTSEGTTPSRPLTPRKGLGSRATSALSLPLKEVPERRSSASFILRNTAASRQSSVNDLPSWKLPTPSAPGQVVPARGHANSPVRAATKNDPISDSIGRSPSKTFIRTTPPMDILDLGTTHHGRVEMNLQTPAPLFVGGGTIEGHIQLTVDGGSVRKAKPNQKPLSISRLSVDVIGVEEVSDGRRWIFLSLATELFDQERPPPASLVSTQVPTPGKELLWPLRPASVVIPFCMNLPLNIGPPPYASRQARIRYLLCATAYVRPAGKLAMIRQSFEIQMLTVFDPEKALSSLPTPLLATDQLSNPQGGRSQNIKLTAGLHRQTWVNGAMIFVDVHLMNNSSKTIKKIEIQLDKTTLWYSHAAAGTSEKSAPHLRLPKRSENEIVCTSSIKKSKEWKGVPPNTSEVRTCDLEVPRGHVTISTGRYFEVRYFLNVIVSVSMFKTIAVQLPITIIHINSLDIVPNSLAQVAASIEAKRARTVPVADEALYPPFHQGQAFTAPRRHSLEQMRRATSAIGVDDIAALTRDLDDSPRRFARASTQGHRHQATMSNTLSAENDPHGRLSMAASSHGHHTRHNSCYHCHLEDAEHMHHSRRKASMSSLPGPKLRLQLSTSGLGFSDSEFEMAPDSPPKKVMLSESERKLILQQRELKLQRELSKKHQSAQQHLQRQPSVRLSKERTGENERVNGPPGGYWGWRNVAAQPMATTAGAVHQAHDRPGMVNIASKVGNTNEMTGSMRSRSNTGPGRLGMSMSSTSIAMNMPPGQGSRQRRKRGSVDRGVVRGSEDRVKGPVGGGGGPGIGKPRGMRKSVENW